jgi:RHH-type rel operon transcriptional repressor/antitoxin RelB
MTDSQMNVRIDRTLKEQGDAVFARIGYSPSQVVRLVWQYASDHGDVPLIVAQALSSTSISVNRDDAHLHKVSTAKDGSRIIETFCEQWGLTSLSDSLDTPYDVARLEAYYEKLEERGLA